METIKPIITPFDTTTVIASIDFPKRVRKISLHFRCFVVLFRTWLDCHGSAFEGASVQNLHGVGGRSLICHLNNAATLRDTPAERKLGKSQTVCVKTFKHSREHALAAGKAKRLPTLMSIETVLCPLCPGGPLDANFSRIPGSILGVGGSFVGPRFFIGHADQQIPAD